SIQRQHIELAIQADMRATNLELAFNAQERSAAANELADINAKLQADFGDAHRDALLERRQRLERQLHLALEQGNASPGEETAPPNPTQHTQVSEAVQRAAAELRATADEQEAVRAELEQMEVQQRWWSEYLDRHGRPPEGVSLEATRPDHVLREQLM